MSTKIQWADETLNPVEAYDENGVRGWHCERVSKGCDNCYAETQNVTARFLGTGLPYVRSSRDKVTFNLNEKTLTQPMRWKRGRTIFWHDMDDLFGEWISDDWIDMHAAVVMLTPQHRHIWLTKRPERMRQYFGGAAAGIAIDRMVRWLAAAAKLAPHGMAEDLAQVTNGALDNLILATTAENQEQADKRIPDLLATPAACRMISMEPQLERITLAPEKTPAERVHEVMTAGPSEMFNKRRPGIDWVIQGGESGAGARPFKVDWARYTRDQCEAAGVPYFLKQLGANVQGDAEEFPTAAIRSTGVLFDEDTPAHRIDDFRLSSPHGSDEDEWPEDLRGCRAFPEMVGR